MLHVSAHAAPRQDGGNTSGADAAHAGRVALLGLLKADHYAFTAVTPSTHAKALRRADRPRPDLRDIFGWSRAFAADAAPLGVVAALRQAAALETAAPGEHRSALRAATLEGELFLHSAYPTLEADAVFFGPDTYRFAAAIGRALESGRPVVRALDIGAGSGAGGVLIAKRRPDADVIMTDVNDKALALARANAESAGATNANAARSDLYASVTGRFDLIVANPPYLVDATQRAYRHGGGAFGEGLSIAILEGALDHLSPGGELVLYTGSAIVDGRDAFREAACARLQSPHVAWAYRETDPDVFAEELDLPPYDVAERIAAVVLNVRKE